MSTIQRLYLKPFAVTSSYIWHPLLLPLYGLFCIFNCDSIFSLIPLSVQVYCYIITFFAVFLLPLLCLIVFKKLNLIESYQLSTKQDRLYPALGAILFIFIGFYVLGRIPYTNIIQQFYLVLIILLAGFALVTIRWKMSMHMTAMGAFCGFLFVIGYRYMGDVESLVMGILLLSGLVGACRLYLKKHNPAQVYAGFLFGVSVVLFILF